MSTTPSRRFHFCVACLSRVMAPKNWLRADNPDGRSVEATLTRCLQSLLQQSCPDVIVHLACHEVPPLPPCVTQDPRLLIHQVDFPRPPDMDLATYNRLSGKILPELPNMVRRRVGDKYSKLKVGLNAAFADPETEFVMLVDHDDAVHRDVAGYALNYTGTDAPGGFLVTRGYSYHTALGTLREVNSFHNLCGTCNAVRLAQWEREKWNTARDVNIFSDTPENRRAHWLFSGHSGVHKTLKKEGRPMGKFPFRAVTYVTGTGANISGTQRTGGSAVRADADVRSAFCL